MFFYTFKFSKQEEHMAMIQTSQAIKKGYASRKMTASVKNGFYLLFTLMAVILLQGQTALSANLSDQDLALLQRTSKAFASIAKEVTPGVVAVQVEKTASSAGMMQFHGGDPFGFFDDPLFEHFFGPQMRPKRSPHNQPKSMGQGSGFIISKDGYILTNNHVVDGADNIKVKLADGRELKAKLIGADPPSDVALIKIEGNNFHALTLGDSDKLEVGEWVIAIGNPFGLQHTVTVGVVSAKGRSRIGINDYEDFIQTDAAINPGNSGGPLVNIQGEVVGMSTAIFSRSGGYMGIGFAIPINMAKSVKDQLLESGKITRGWLGVIIQEIDEDIAQSFGLKSAKEGVLIAEVAKDSPAEKAGLKDGDIILDMNGVKTTDVGELRNKIALMRPNTVVKFTILRDGKQMPVSVTIGEQNPAKMAKLDTPKLVKDMGITVQNLTPELAEQFGYKMGQGVIITDVEQGSLADQAGLRPGQLIESVNQNPVKNQADFHKAIASSAKNVLVMKIRAGTMSRFVAIRLK
jgi:serine protease Do